MGKLRLRLPVQIAKKRPHLADLGLLSNNKGNPKNEVHLGRTFFVMFFFDCV